MKSRQCWQKIWGSEMIITTFDIIQPNLVWSFNSKLSQYQNFYEGNLDSLFQRDQTKTANLVDSGLQLIKNRNPILFNIFRVLVDFYNDIQFSNDPSITSTDDARQEFINETRREVIKQLERAYIQYLIKGRAVLKVDEMPDGNRIRSVNTDNYFPVVNPIDADEIMGHILAYPFSTQTDPSLIGEIDRIYMVLFQKDVINEARVYEYSGGILGQLLKQEQSNVVEILHYGEGLNDSLYRDVESLVRELMIRLTGMSIVLNRHTKPDVIAPANFNKNNIQITGESRVLVTPANADGTFSYLTFDGQLQSNTDMIATLVDSISIATGLSKTAFGVSVGGNESGVSRERAMQKQLARTQRDRKAQEGILEPLYNALGSMGGDINIQFVDDPLSHPTEQIQGLVELYDRRIITKDEVRDKTSWSPLTDEQRVELDGTQSTTDNTDA